MKLAREVITRRDVRFRLAALALAVMAWSGATILAADQFVRHRGDVVGALAFVTDDLTVTATATVGTTLGVTGLITATGGIDSSSGPTLVGGMRGTIQTSSVTGTNDNFVINASTTQLNWNGASNGTFTGFKCGAADCSASDTGRLLYVHNVGSNAFTLSNEAAGSVATNRFSLPSSAQYVMTAFTGALLEYDGAATRWHLVSWSSARVDAAFQFASTLAVSGAATFSGGLTLQSSGGLLITTTNGHIRGTGTPPVLTSCGTSPSIAGSDIGGRITVGSAITTCTITFTGTYTNAPACIVHSEATAVQPTYTTSATAITMSVAIASTVYDYVCIGVI